MNTINTTTNYKITAEHPEAENGQQELTGYRTVVRDGSKIAYDSQSARPRTRTRSGD